MARRFTIPTIVRAALPMAVLSGVCAAQTTSGQKPADQQQCQPTKAGSETPCPATSGKHPSAAEQFPFPGKTEAPASATTPNAPAPNAPATSHPSAAAEHPFPGDAPSASDADSSSSSSSADDVPTTPPSDDHPWDDKGDNPQAERRKLPKVQKLQSDEDRATEDLNVAKFYEDRGNLNAAYMRTKDAVKIQPNDPDTHFALAQVAQKMNKRDEAIAEFTAYLKLDPDGLRVKEAHKALTQLSAK